MSEDSAGFLVLIALAFVVGSLGIQLPAAEQPQQEPCQHWLWPQARDAEGRWPGFIKWEECQ